MRVEDLIAGQKYKAKWYVDPIIYVQTLSSDDFIWKGYKYLFKVHMDRPEDLEKLTVFKQGMLLNENLVGELNC